MSSSFIEYMDLIESESPHEDGLAVFTFGRFQPVTKGHARLVEKISSIASEKGGDYLIFPSRSVDHKKNPIPAEEKISFIKEFIPEANVVDDASVKTPFSCLRYLLERGYSRLVMVVGSDRVDDMTALREAALKTFRSIDIVSAGERDPDSEGIIGMSATKARTAALSEDIAAFRVATGWSGPESERLMEAVARGLKGNR